MTVKYDQTDDEFEQYLEDQYQAKLVKSRNATPSELLFVFSVMALATMAFVNYMLN